MSFFQTFFIVTLLLGSPAAEQPAELRFSEIFAPTGSRGLEFSALSRRLEGRRVRVAGYMVRRDHPATGTFLFAPVPIQLHDEEYGLADDLPAATVLVEGSCLSGGPIPYTSRRLALTGVLRLGPREEPDGRTSFVRLAIDELSPDFPQP